MDHNELLVIYFFMYLHMSCKILYNFKSGLANILFDSLFIIGISSIQKHEMSDLRIEEFLALERWEWHLFDQRQYQNQGSPFL